MRLVGISKYCSGRYGSLTAHSRLEVTSLHGDGFFAAVAAWGTQLLQDNLA
ncbi:hypothetical protein LAD77_00515 [Klebsiella pneumoniae]|nr:hypothetical protein [Klebsiella pneumoniae]